jgi:NTE family protein
VWGLALELLKNMVKTKPQKQKTCLILGGGGARGLSHLGVLEVLEREGIEVDCVVGTSVGAVVGAVYALASDAKEVNEIARNYFTSDAFQKNTFKQAMLKSKEVEQSFFRNVFSSIKKSYVFSNLLRKQAIFPGDRLSEMVDDLVLDKDITETRIPFAVPALDISNGREILLTEGRLRQAVLASCSLPGFFPPVERDGVLLSDAGTIAPVPVTMARKHFQPTRVIAVDITSRLEGFSAEATGLEVILRVDAIACKRFNDLEVAGADVVIRPHVGNRYWSDFSDFDSLIAAGATAAEACLPELRALQEAEFEPFQAGVVRQDEEKPLSWWQRLVASLKGKRPEA